MRGLPTFLQLCLISTLIIDCGAQEQQQKAPKVIKEDKALKRELKMDTNVKQIVPLLSVSNIEKSVAFFVDGLGFEFDNKWVQDGKLRWCKIKQGGSALMLQEFNTEGKNAFKPIGKLGEGVTFYFICEDALKIYHDIKKRGLDASEPIVENSNWVTNIYDPDGYKISFESHTDVKRGTKLSELEDSK